MPLPPGIRLGPYEILSPLGAGGMGEVYRARDTRLDRDVALKIIPPGLAGSDEALQRFEREAKAVAALSHPNILAIHDIGRHDGISYTVSELLEGATLRERLAAGPVPLRKALDYAIQIAHALAGAHDKGIVHRDLKPDNICVTGDGRVKVLDFGLARQVMAAASNVDPAPTMTLAPPTEPGTVLGTVGYMAPEQVRGEPSDARSDIFSFGCVLYEMLGRRRAFARDSAVETMTAILNDEPTELSDLGVAVSPALGRIVRRCLEKVPGDRFQSAHDLVFALQGVVDDSGTGVREAGAAARATAGPVWTRLRGSPVAVLALLALACTFALGVLAGRAMRPAASARGEATFTRLTFNSGIIRQARFAEDGKTILYSAAWDGKPPHIFMTRTDSPSSTALNLPDAELLSVSSQGEVALLLAPRSMGWMVEGTLARAPLLGGSARPVLDHVREADWTPDGSALAIVRRVDGRERLEYPVGKVLYQTSGYISHIRFSPAGDTIAFADHPMYADDYGHLATVDLAGHKADLSPLYPSLRGIAWSPDGREIWMTATRQGTSSTLYAVDRSGHQRVVLEGPTELLLLDLARDGTTLVATETSIRRVEAQMANDAAPRDYSIKEGSIGRYISPDGQSMLISDQSVPGYAIYLQRADGSPPIRLGEGDGFDLSPDGKWVLAMTPDSVPRILLQPTGIGQPRSIENVDQLSLESGAWLKDGRRVLLYGGSRAGLRRCYVMDLATKNARPLTPDGMDMDPFDAFLMTSPDGARLLARDTDGHVFLFPIAGGSPQPVADVQAEDIPVGWSSDGRSIFVARTGETPWHVRRFDLATRAQAPVKDIAPAEKSGLRLSYLMVSGDGRYFLHSYSRLLSTLYFVDG
ncbi:MAG: protein kinase domain-containing protein, partial [Bacteroidales bacterium]